jgi:hypothetical protein
MKKKHRFCNDRFDAGFNFHLDYVCTQSTKRFAVLITAAYRNLDMKKNLIQGSLLGMHALLQKITESTTARRRKNREVSVLLLAIL